MGRHRYFVDTSFLIALADRSDEHHQEAVQSYRGLVASRGYFVTTSAVLIEFGNGLSKLPWREVAFRIITEILENKEVFYVVHVDKQTLSKGVGLYGSRKDKEWSLCDCISFVVMERRKLFNALAFDSHFTQAGYNL